MPENPARRRAESSSDRTKDDGRLRKHADYQRVYREGKRHSLPLMTYFVAPRKSGATFPEGGQPEEYAAATGARIGLTAGRVLGKAVERNRIKRRMREAIRRHRGELSAAVDVIFHPRRTVLEADFSAIERDVKRALGAAQTAERQSQERSQEPRTASGPRG
jgi:ribonuclease P protein component